MAVFLLQVRVKGIRIQVDSKPNKGKEMNDYSFNCKLFVSIPVLLQAVAAAGLLLLSRYDSMGDAPDALFLWSYVAMAILIIGALPAVGLDVIALSNYKKAKRAGQDPPAWAYILAIADIFISLLILIIYIRVKM